MKLVFELRSALEARGLDIKDIAEVTPFTLEELEGIENGRYKAYRIATIEILCEAIGCDPSELLYAKRC